MSEITKITPWVEKPTVEGTPNFISELIYNNEREQPDQYVFFDSAYQMIDAININAERGFWRHQRQEEKMWQYGNDMDREKTFDCLTSGKTIHPEYIEMVDMFKIDLFTKYPQLYELERTALLNKRRVQKSEEGSELCIDSYMSGDPNHWIQPHNIQVKKAFKIFINAAVLGHNGPQVFMRNMAMFIALVDIIESAGIRCELHIGAISSDSTDSINTNWISCMGKAANEPVDVNRLLSFGYPGFFRDVIFSLRYATLLGRLDEGMGRSKYEYDSKMLHRYGYDLALSASNEDESCTMFIDKIMDLFGDHKQEKTDPIPDDFSF